MPIVLKFQKTKNIFLFIYFRKNDDVQSDDNGVYLFQILNICLPIIQEKLKILKNERLQLHDGQINDENDVWRKGMPGKLQNRGPSNTIQPLAQRFFNHLQSSHSLSAQSMLPARNFIFFCPRTYSEVPSLKDGRFDPKFSDPSACPMKGGLKSLWRRSLGS